MGMFGLWPGPLRRRTASAPATRDETSGDPGDAGDLLHRRARELAAATDPEARARAATELRHALRDLCDLALAGGTGVADLGASVRGLASAMPFPVTVTVDVGPVAPAVAATAYAVICEALANAAGHAHARRAVVTVQRHGPTVQVAVADDGDGGARPVIGGGIVMLAARVAALRGLLHLDSPAGSGTHLTVELPAG
ncbi:hypothetical protein [Dactylosporangium sp. NPDC000521]|uniref:hypothetical protein n=1 Tax=Dactylosporangium sp. NPDC000521 TaxID=3363975 RepID=UPI0036BE1BB1